MAAGHRIAHLLNFGYVPWTNGTVDLIKQDIISATREVLDELKLAPKYCPSIISFIPPILNETHIPRFGKDAEGNIFSPLKVLIGIRPRRILLLVIPDVTENRKTLDIDRKRGEKRSKI